MKGKALYRLILILSLILMMPAFSSAALCPKIEPLGAMSGGGDFEPMRVAVDSKGKVYVTDKFNKNLKVFDHKGSLLKKMDVNVPLGIAVDGSGKIYLGRAEDKRGLYTGDVIVYDVNFNLLFSLGKGWGEFSYPDAIATDATRVYVADGRANLVKVYDSSNGKFLFSFGGYGHCDTDKDGVSDGCGHLVAPTGIYVHPVTGNLYVTDRALISEGYMGGTWGLGAGVHVFTRDGAFIKMFGRYQQFDYYGNVVGADKPGYMMVPANVAIDDANRVIVSDFSNGYLHVFGDDGTPLCVIEQGSNFPQGLEYTAEGKLLIATLKSIALRGVDNYVGMSVEPKELTYDVSKCGSSSGKNISVTNGGPGVLNWSAKSDKPWITFTGNSGSINGKATVSVPVKVDVSSLSPGSYKGTVTVTGQGAEEKVEITVEVKQMPAIKASPIALQFKASGTQPPQAQSLNVDMGSGGAGWSASSDSLWLSVTPSTGPSGALTFASVTADVTGMSSGNYSGKVTINSTCASGSPVSVPVTLTYVKGGAVYITSNIEEAAFTLSGPSSGAGSGKSYAFTGLPKGTYTVNFVSLKGFKAPAPKTVTIADGGSGSAEGYYKDLREANDIIATMGTGKWTVPDDLKVLDTAGLVYKTVTLGTASVDRTRSADASRVGSSTASGDVDGDGIDDIVTANDKGVISGFKADGTPIKGLYFAAFAYKSAVDIAAGDVDGDGISEMIVGAGPGNQAVVRAFKLKGGVVSDTGINFMAYDNLYGVNVAAGDIDGDGVSEILTAPAGGPGEGAAAKIRIWKADISKGAGAWGVKDAGIIDAGPSLAGADIAAGDLDADAVDEIIASTVPASKTAGVTAYKPDGSVVLAFSQATAGGVNIAAGDTDLDGASEIVVGEGAAGLSTVKVYGADGKVRKEFKAFDSLNIYGVKVSLGRVAD